MKISQPEPPAGRQAAKRFVGAVSGIVSGILFRMPCQSGILYHDWPDPSLLLDSPLTYIGQTPAGLGVVGSPTTAAGL